MTIQPGTTLGPYSVTAKIGEGGMGEVYRARDTTLDRDVALKVLPEAFTSDPDRLARFEREAKVLASLNHPNIGSIHGLEESDGVKALVLELIEGPTLADRIAQGPVPVDEALPIAKQIAEALEAAHEAGVIHRDLKPANIKVRPDGTVKVLDFGLAKALESDLGADPSESPTLTAAATRAGVILGTAAYMAPEQAKGRPVDKRADVWAFGCVLYEMLTGRRAFDGQDVADTFAEVIKSEPDWQALPHGLSSTTAVYLRRCLEKEPKRRVHDMADMRLAMEGAFDAEAHPVQLSSRTPWPTIGIAGAASLVIGAAAATYLPFGEGLSDGSSLTRFAIDTSPAPLFDRDDPNVTISPDGDRVVYVARPRGTSGQLYARSLDDLDAAPFQGLGGIPRTPFVSPDGEWLAYFQAIYALRRVPLDGGPSELICLTGAAPKGASWGADGNIVFGTEDLRTGLWEVADGGGEPIEITTPEAGTGDHVFPDHLPGGEALLFTMAPELSVNAQIAVLVRNTGEYKILTRGYHARYAPTGHIVFGRNGGLWAAAFDADALALVGDPVEVLAEVATSDAGAVQFDFSSTGTLTYVIPGPAPRSALLWVNREGETVGQIPDEAVQFHKAPRLSPDGSRVVLQKARGAARGIWVHQLPSGREMLLAAELPQRINPVWTPDGSQVIYSLLEEGTDSVRFRMHSRGIAPSGSDELFLDIGNAFVPSWAPDGKSFAYYLSGSQGSGDLWRMDADGAPHVFLATEFDERSPRVSPDGRWVAYVSDQPGERRVFVQPFPEGGEAVWVSPGWGTEVAWSRDGRELFYRNRTSLMTVPVDTREGFSQAVPVPLFEDTYELDPWGNGFPNYDVSLDGQQFLMVRLEGGEGAPHQPGLVLRTRASGAEELMPLQPGSTLGPYTVAAKIGEGGMDI